MMGMRVGSGKSAAPGQEERDLAFGAMLAACLEAAEILDATVANMRFVKPLRWGGKALAAEHDLLVTIEERLMGVRVGCVRSTHLTQNGLPVLLRGLPDRS